MQCGMFFFFLGGMQQFNCCLHEAECSPVMQVALVIALKAAAISKCLLFLQARGRIRRLARQQASASSSADSAKGGPSRLLSVFCPLLKAFSGGDAAAARPRWLEVLPLKHNIMLALTSLASAGRATVDVANVPCQSHIA